MAPNSSTTSSNFKGARASNQPRTGAHASGTSSASGGQVRTTKTRFNDLHRDGETTSTSHNLAQLPTSHPSATRKTSMLTYAKFRSITSEKDGKGFLPSQPTYHLSASGNGNVSIEARAFVPVDGTDWNPRTKLTIGTRENPGTVKVVTLRFQLTAEEFSRSGLKAPFRLPDDTSDIFPPSICVEDEGEIPTESYGQQIRSQRICDLVPIVQVYPDISPEHAHARVFMPKYFLLWGKKRGTPVRIELVPGDTLEEIVDLFVAAAVTKTILPECVNRDVIVKSKGRSKIYTPSGFSTFPDQTVFADGQLLEAIAKVKPFVDTQSAKRDQRYKQKQVKKQTKKQKQPTVHADGFVTVRTGGSRTATASASASASASTSSTLALSSLFPAESDHESEEEDSPVTALQPTIADVVCMSSTPTFAQLVAMSPKPAIAKVVLKPSTPPLADVVLMPSTPPLADVVLIPSTPPLAETVKPLLTSKKPSRKPRPQSLQAFFNAPSVEAELTSTSSKPEEIDVETLQLCTGDDGFKQVCISSASAPAKAVVMKSSPRVSHRKKLTEKEYNEIKEKERLDKLALTLRSQKASPRHGGASSAKTDRSTPVKLTAEQRKDKANKAKSDKQAKKLSDQQAKGKHHPGKKDGSPRT